MWVQNKNHPMFSLPRIKAYELLDGESPTSSQNNGFKQTTQRQNTEIRWNTAD